VDKQAQEAPALADDLLVGAEKIAEYLYQDATRVRDVYRNVGGLTFLNTARLLRHSRAPCEKSCGRPNGKRANSVNN